MGTGHLSPKALTVDVFPADVPEVDVRQMTYGQSSA